MKSFSYVFVPNFVSSMAVLVSVAGIILIFFKGYYFLKIPRHVDRDYSEIYFTPLVSGRLGHLIKIMIFFACLIGELQQSHFLLMLIMLTTSYLL